MDKEQMFNSLVENAIDFLSKALSEIEEQPKYSMINFHAAVGLFMKARLMKEHWSLVVTSREEPDWNKFVRGDFRSVSLDEAINRLEKIVKNNFSSTEKKAFRDVAQHRNKIVHFFHESHTQENNDQFRSEVVRHQLNSWYLLHRLLTIKWNKEFSPWSEKLESMDGNLRKLHDFLIVIFDNIKEEIELRKKNGDVYRECLSCGFESEKYENVQYQIYESNCLVCMRETKNIDIKCPNCESIVSFRGDGFALCSSCKKNIDPPHLANELIDKNASHEAHKEGDNSWDLGNCSNCGGYHEVARAADDEWICVSCFQVFDQLNECEWCNEYTTEDLTLSYSFGCSFCEGAIGYDQYD